MITVSGIGPIRATPLSILGSALLFADYWAADRNNVAAVNPRITITGAGVSDWPEEATRNVALTQGTDANRPVLSATSFGGRPGVTLDGSNDGLFCTMSPSMAIGSRLYIWLVAHWTTTSIGKDYARSVEISRETAGVADAAVAIISATDAGNLFGGFGNLSDGDDDAAGVAANGQAISTTRGVWEYGLLATTTGKFVQSGTATDGTFTGTLKTGTHAKLSLGCRHQTTGAELLEAPVCVHRLVIAHNPADITALPTSAQLTAMRAYLSGFL